MCSDLLQLFNYFWNLPCTAAFYRMELSHMFCSPMRAVEVPSSPHLLSQIFIISKSHVLWQNRYTLISIIACITRNTILTMIQIVGRYGDPYWRSQACHEIDYLEHTKWILKDIRRKHNLTWFSPNLAYVNGERTWKSFINKLDTNSSNIPLNDTRVIYFLLKFTPRL